MNLDLLPLFIAFWGFLNLFACYLLHVELKNIEDKLNNDDED